MKLGIFSDLHLEFDRSGRDYSQSLLPDVFYICAGDTHPSAQQRKFFYSQFGENIFYVDGNHDFYGSSFEGNLSDQPMKTKVLFNGMTIAGATLWTDLSNQYDWYIYTRSLVDIYHIKGLNKEDYNTAHKMHLEFLMESNADIFVSHHCPSRFSVHPKYAQEPSNVGFVTDLTDGILAMKKPPKLWVHGHTHESFDYMIGGTRVICHPRGYPRERDHYETYEPMILEI